MLQFITSTHAPISVEEQVRAALLGGCRWIQIRMKEASDDEVAAVVEAVKPDCLAVEAFLILNDRVELAKRLDVGGVHLGHDDMPPSKARLTLGAAAVIGVTANTLADIRAVSALDIDYIGLGPYADTSTKARLAPILGPEGVRRVIRETREAGISLPIVAVGGITPADVLPLKQAGANGVAVSAAIACSPDPVAATEEFIRLLGHV